MTISPRRIFQCELRIHIWVLLVTLDALRYPFQDRRMSRDWSGGVQSKRVRCLAAVCFIKYLKMSLQKAFCLWVSEILILGALSPILVGVTTLAAFQIIRSAD